MKGKFIYANGMNISQARKLFKFYFVDFFLRAEKNEKEFRFDVFLRDSYIDAENQIQNLDDWCDLEYFNKFWNEESNRIPSNGKFHLIVMKEKQNK